MSEQEAKELREATESLAEKLGIPMSFSRDPELSGYRRGEPLRYEALLTLPENTVVWFTYREYGADYDRIDGAFRISPGNVGWILDDGSSFGTDFVPEDALEPGMACTLEECEGESSLFVAVPKEPCRMCGSKLHVTPSPDAASDCPACGGKGCKECGNHGVVLTVSGERMLEHMKQMQVERES